MTLTKLGVHGAIILDVVDEGILGLELQIFSHLPKPSTAMKPAHRTALRLMSVSSLHSTTPFTISAAKLTDWCQLLEVLFQKE
jgi:hypothetical protein